MPAEGVRVHWCLADRSGRWWPNYARRNIRDLRCRRKGQGLHRAHASTSAQLCVRRLALPPQRSLATVLSLPLSNSKSPAMTEGAGRAQAPILLDLNRPELEALRAFRHHVSTLFWCRGGALFDILDAVLSPPSLETPAHLSLTPSSVSPSRFVPPTHTP